jgi:hypothetical protein
MMYMYVAREVYCDCPMVMQLPIEPGASANMKVRVYRVAVSPRASARPYVSYDRPRGARAQGGGLSPLYSLLYS